MNIMLTSLVIMLLALKMFCFLVIKNYSVKLIIVIPLAVQLGIALLRPAISVLFSYGFGALGAQSLYFLIVLGQADFRM